MEFQYFIVIEAMLISTMYLLASHLNISKFPLADVISKLKNAYISANNNVLGTGTIALRSTRSAETCIKIRVHYDLKLYNKLSQNI